MSRNFFVNSLVLEKAGGSYANFLRSQPVPNNLRVPATVVNPPPLRNELAIRKDKQALVSDGEIMDISTFDQGNGSEEFKKSKVYGNRRRTLAEEPEGHEEEGADDEEETGVPSGQEEETKEEEGGIMPKEKFDKLRQGIPADQAIQMADIVEKLLERFDNRKMRKALLHFINQYEEDNPNLQQEMHEWASRHYNKKKKSLPKAMTRFQAEMNSQGLWTIGARAFVTRYLKATAK